jgi:hypothetical protein
MRALIVAVAIGINLSNVSPRNLREQFNLVDSIYMLWPAPRSGAPVTLACGCDATVTWHVPIAYIYRVHIDRKAQDCARHRTGTGSFAGLEGINPRADKPSAG